MRHGPSERIVNQSLEIGGKVGFHRFWLNLYSNQLSASGDPAQARAQGFEIALSGAAAVMRYAADLNIDFKFIARTMAKPSENFEYLNTAEEFLTLNVCPIGLRRPEISPAQQALNICNHSMAGADRLGTSPITEMTPQQAKRYMLENVQKNMLLLKVKGALSTQLASYSVMREQPGIDGLYADMQAAGVRLPKIVGPVFEVAGYQTSEGETQCFVSLSLDDPNQFEVAIRHPKIWAHPNRAAPRQCRGLFLHDQEATVNAHP